MAGLKRQDDCVQQVKGKETLSELTNTNAIKVIMFSTNVLASHAHFKFWYLTLTTSRKQRLPESNDLPAKATNPPK